MTFETQTIGMATSIYALCDPLTDEVRYVGKTVRSLHLRLTQHRNVSKRGSLPVNCWMRKHQDVNLTGPYIKLLEIVAPSDDWAERESAWIAFFGARLLNLTSGGEGLAGHKFTQEHRQKISSALKTGAFQACISCGSDFWRKANEIAKGNNKYCCKTCYFDSQKGVTKINTHLPMAAIKQAAKIKNAMTHCKRGHEFSVENVYVSPSGRRVCKECRKIHKAKAKHD